MAAPDAPWICRRVPRADAPTNGGITTLRAADDSLLAAAVAQGAVAAVQFGVAAVGPDLQTRYGLSAAGLGALFSAYLFTNGVFLIPAGAAIDQLNPRWVTIGGGAIAVGALLVAAVTLQRAGLFIGLSGAGLGAAVVPVAGAHAVFRAYAEERRAWAFGVRQAAVPLGGVAAILAIPRLTAAGGVPLMFYALAGTTAVSSVWLAAVVPARTTAVRERRALRRIWRTPTMKRTLAVASLYVFMVQALVTYTVPAGRAEGLSPLAAESVFVAVTLSGGIGRIVWGRIADRSGRFTALSRIGVASAIGSWIFAAALHGGVFVAATAAVLFAFGAFGWNAIVYVTAAERVPTGLLAESLALALAVVFVISAVGTLILGVVVDAVGWDALWLISGLLAVPGALIAAKGARVIAETANSAEPVALTEP